MLIQPPKQDENKAMVRQILEMLPKRSRYATKVVEYLASQVVTVSLAMVYQTATGRTYHLDIINAIVEVYEQFQREEAELHQRLK